MQDVGNNLNISLSSSEQVTPNFWTDPKNGIPYFMPVQTPEYRIATKNQLDNTPLASAVDPEGTPIPTMLGNLATSKRIGVQSVYNHSNIQAVYDIYGSVQDRDLGSVAADLRKVVAEVEPQLTPGNHIVIRGQIDSMQSAFGNLARRPAVRGGVCLYADGDKLSEFYRPPRGDLGPSWRWRRHSPDAVRHWHDFERSFAHGLDHGGRRRFGELDPARHVRA